MYRAAAVIESPLRLHGASTFLNGERISGRRRLKDGDVLRWEDTLIAFSETQRRVLVALCRPFKDTNGFASPVFLSVEAVKTHLRGPLEKFGVAHLPQNQKRLRLVERAFQERADLPA
jgi:pSer/pThr/pTyr-binding forkhead associated (FHA) protein